MRIAVVVVVLVAATVNNLESLAETCVGDCNNDSEVAVNELILGVNIALGSAPLATCPSFDADLNSRADINEILQAVNNALCGCNTPCNPPTASPTRTPTPTPTPTAGPPTPTHVPLTTAFDACAANCRVAQQLCGDSVFFEKYRYYDCTDDCASRVEHFASRVVNFNGCVEAQVRLIQCCTRCGQCGHIPNCDADFDAAGVACGGVFAGCPLIFL
jgi:hypothetical protein